MNKKIVLRFILCCSLCFFPIGVQQNKAQFAVVDGFNGGLNAAIQALNEAANQISKFMSDVEKLKLATDAIDQIESITEILNLFDDLACLSSDFKFYMNLNNHYACAKYLDSKLVTLNLNYSTEILRNALLLKNLLTMTTSDRLSNLETVRKTLQETVNQMKDLNNKIRSNINRHIYSKTIKRNYYNMSGLAYNKYK